MTNDPIAILILTKSKPGSSGPHRCRLPLTLAMVQISQILTEAQKHV